MCFVIQQRRIVVVVNVAAKIDFRITKRVADKTDIKIFNFDFDNFYRNAAVEIDKYFNNFEIDK